MCLSIGGIIFVYYTHGNETILRVLGIVKAFQKASVGNLLRGQSKNHLSILY